MTEGKKAEREAKQIVKRVFEGKFDTFAYKCLKCGLRRPYDVPEDKETPSIVTVPCWDQCDDATDHVETGKWWIPVRLVYECPMCGYETTFWEDPVGTDDTRDLPECHQCDAVPPQDTVRNLLRVSGVGKNKAAMLADEGITSVDELRHVSQEEIAAIDGFGEALAARIKADIGSPTNAKEPKDPRVRVPSMRLTEVVLRADLEE